MNKPIEKYHDAEDARNVAILRERMTAEVEGLRESLAVWIEENTQHPIDAAVSIAMLETAFDRYIEPSSLSRISARTLKSPSGYFSR
jgi:hypothetical protein